MLVLIQSVSVVRTVCSPVQSCVLVILVFAIYLPFRKKKKRPLLRTIWCLTQYIVPIDGVVYPTFYGDHHNGVDRFLNVEMELKVPQRKKKTVNIFLVKCLKRILYTMGSQYPIYIAPSIFFNLNMTHHIPPIHTVVWNPINW